MEASTLIPVAKIAGVTSAACLAGMIANFSHMGMPVIALAPVDTKLKQWAHAYALGKSAAPPLALTSAACFGFLAYATWDSVPVPATIAGASSPLLCATAMVLIPAIVPFTLAVMGPRVNDRLSELAARAEKGAKGSVGVEVASEEVQGLIERWRAMNYVRAGIVGTGALLGAAAVVAL